MMSDAIANKSSSAATDGLLPAVASALVPGLGQLINQQGNKALGVFAVWFVAGFGVLGVVPLPGNLAAATGAATWLYAVADSYLIGRRKRLNRTPRPAP